MHFDLHLLLHIKEPKATIAREACDAHPEPKATKVNRRIRVAEGYDRVGLHLRAGLVIKGWTTITVIYTTIGATILIVRRDP